MKLSEEDKNRQINKEAIISIIVYVLYFIWWYITGFGLGNRDPSTYKYVMGFPVWFILSCFVGPILLILVVIFTVKHFFVNFNLNSDENDDK
ncbi:MAG: YhdT family protein [Clostridium sp.]|uniref:YhdT family protein n=1 Tax=Clostridium sp. TaxID=1506 RepID=UPI003074D1AB